ncbi:hypothetical protein [Edwardsiella ictaluri]|uniref:hypothetical protein n=1 Tax=Edwardsiella ictaluri TaxID=67780 RepID=UPI0018DB8DA8|nr:hypothetical protein [Edwardsiella ictaluri]QPW28870.1 hypothetical protein F8539_01530 [Edwardsiella ictaluri]UYB61984.1 hypothetical protein N8I66_01500 [Edwardsiella ictaluri]UYB65210.1 hypothetical protein N8I67_01500 [Edwardsiella ictaluri]BEH97555.1 hypothetical protein KH20906_02830 [Edwardsiella ictaluri]BEI01021.1 hypothetical protein KB20921_02820 [Edwardsiella ictaluri]
MNMFMKRLLNAVLSDPQPNNQTDDSSLMTSFKDEVEDTPALFDTRPYLDFEQWYNDNN